MKLLKLFVFSTFWMTSVAYGYDVRSTLVEKKSYLSISGEMSQLKLEDGSLTGSGVKFDFSHAFTKSVALEVYLSTALGGGGSVSATFTGIGGYAYYNLFGSCCQEERTIMVDGAAVITERSEQDHLLQVGAGLDQLLLNGSKGVYSTSGPGFGANYQFKAWDFRIKLSGRMSQMTANKEKVSATFVGLGLVFPL